MPIAIDRRGVLLAAATGAVGGIAGLVLGIRRGTNKERWRKRTPPRAQVFAPSIFLAIDTDDTVTVWLTKAELGQGAKTALPMIIGDELEVDWRTMRVEHAIANDNYGNMLTAVSASVSGLYEPLRQAGATAREMLIAAAAQTWGVEPGSCVARSGDVIHSATGRRVRFGAVAARAATLAVPEAPALKPQDEHRLIGTDVDRIDIPDKVTGAAEFGIDVRLAGMVYATVRRCPVFGGKLKSFAEAKVPGVIEVRPIASGIAVVANDTWAAFQGASQLELEWSDGDQTIVSTASIDEALIAAASKPGVVARTDGAGASKIDSAGRVVEATYQLPYLAHAPMEPISCTAQVGDGRCEVWASTQDPSKVQRIAAQMTGLADADVVVRTPLIGGAFGRRVETDEVRDVLELAVALKRPVKVTWTREEDIQHDWYRPCALHRMRAVIDDLGRPTSWHHKNVSPSIVARDPAFTGDIDPVAVEGGQTMPYDIANVCYEYVKVDLPVPLGFWRSVGHSHNAFAVECFIDELASVAGQDPVMYRRMLLGGQRRHLGVLEAAARLADWRKPPPEGRARGVAVHESFGSYVAQIAEVSVTDGRPRVHRVACAIDCGIAVHPKNIEAQIEGGIVFGLTAALRGAITIDRGRVAQSNFHDYPALRFSEMPEVRVHIVKTNWFPGGVGEVGVPPIAPAVANAIFAATQQRIRKLPFGA